MLTYLEGDIFHSLAQVIVNTVNTAGVMGKGIALTFRNRYPEMYSIYRQACACHKLTIGRLLLWYGTDHWVLNFPTKEHWRNPSKLEYIEQGLKKFDQKYLDYNIYSVAFPRLGCGNGGLRWEDVKPLMERYLRDLPIDVFIYLGPGEASSPGPSGSQSMEDWLSKNYKEMDFPSVKEDILCQSAISPLTFKSGKIQWEAHWDKAKSSLLFTEGAGSSLSIEEDSLWKIWDAIDGRQVFPEADDLSINLYYDLLLTMGYLTRIRILDPDSGTFRNGYQLDVGRNRYYLAKGL